MNQRILAVDDEPHMLKLLERIVTEKTPYRIVVTNNPLEVPGILEQAEFDVIITDLKMPKMDGLDLLRLVKEQGRSEEVIVITAFGSLESAVEALSLGVFDYITKPFRKEQILFTIDRAMRWQKMKKEAARVSMIFEREPYESALQSFKREYLFQLGNRSGWDPQSMAERSGMPLEDIASAITEKQSGSA